jgi:branched-chain amino acid aminotransferase
MSTPRSDWIWFNGDYVPWDEANVHVTTHALHYGFWGWKNIFAGCLIPAALFALKYHSVLKR